MIPKTRNRSYFLFATLLFAVSRVESQTFNTKTIKVTVEGRASSSCNPRAGDSRNMESCRLRVVIDGPSKRKLLLPWEISSLEQVREVSPNTLVFIGKLPSTQGFMMTAQSFNGASSPFNLLAETVSIGPNSKSIVSQEYYPPHGGVVPFVKLVETELNEQNLKASSSRIILSSHALGIDGVMGSILCSEGLSWSPSGKELLSCVQSLDDKLLHLVLLQREEDNAWVIYKFSVGAASLCRITLSTDRKTCSVTVRQMAIQGAGISFKASIQDNEGLQEKDLVIRRAEFLRVSTKLK